MRALHGLNLVSVRARLAKRAIFRSSLVAAWLLILAPLLALAPMPALASCPVCDRDTGVQVRAGIFNEDFGFNLAMTALPFALFLAIIAAIHFGVPRRRT